MTEDPRYAVTMTSHFGGGPPEAHRVTGVTLTINVPVPSSAPRVLRAVADRLELDRLTLEGSDG